LTQLLSVLSLLAVQRDDVSSKRDGSLFKLTACMHGASYRGDGSALLRNLATRL
jgi:hypothetical protein